MNRRRLIFGFVFLFMGILLLVGTAAEFDRRVKAEAKYADDHPWEWVPAARLWTVEEGAGWTGLTSVAGGLVLLILEGINRMRRREIQ